MITNWFFAIYAYVVSIPARMKGMKFGKNSYLGPGYDFLFGSFKGVTVGDDVQIGRNAWIQIRDSYKKDTKIIIDDGSRIGRYATIIAMKRIIIGKNSLISYNVTILDYDHDLHDKKIAPRDSGYTNGEEVVIGDECFIGAHSFIFKGVHLGKHCVVGANSVVTKSFPPYSVVAGNPAKLIRTIQ